jgi:hypothetical protein
MPITQMRHVLGLVVFANDGATKLFEVKNETLAQGLLLPDFPKVGESAEFIFGGQPHQTTITKKSRSYMIDGGMNITHHLVIHATIAP